MGLGRRVCVGCRSHRRTVYSPNRGRKHAASLCLSRACRRQFRGTPLAPPGRHQGRPTSRVDWQSSQREASSSCPYGRIVEFDCPLRSVPQGGPNGRQISCEPVPRAAGTGAARAPRFNEAPNTRVQQGPRDEARAVTEGSTASSAGSAPRPRARGQRSLRLGRTLGRREFRFSRLQDARTY